MDGTGEPDGPPVRMLPAMIDYSAGLNAALGVLASLWGRIRTGKGQRIDISLMDVALTSMHQYVTHYKRTGQLPQRAGSATQQPAWAPYQNFETRDGLVLIAVTTDAMWRNLCKVLVLNEMGKNPLYATVRARSENRGTLNPALNEVTRQYGSEELESKLSEAGIPCAKVRNLGEMIRDPYVEFRQILDEGEHPTMGYVSTVKLPIFFSDKSFPIRRRAPLLGENTHEILRELGYSDQGIQDLIDRGIAFQSHP
jgi:formyl-CoA transferase/CoA:oxalate CoA-transferase